ncbi:hypothetical protein I7I53_01419 [Histoplasma capsulatum var. duboisii H88]|uniref:Uncharacterized protein n=1 Tax=Ajellomyces capsulatus (strain H88) TaxID=544711 RepID=A0A8A1LKK0_AJEC8|nr:hypothetical protein I7I53_01419 [Histoplasma capsulatum var. duboisii H88]
MMTMNHVRLANYDNFFPEIYHTDIFSNIFKCTLFKFCTSTQHQDYRKKLVGQQHPNAKKKKRLKATLQLYT